MKQRIDLIAMGLVACVSLGSRDCLAGLWFPVVNDELAIVSLNQDSVVVRGRTVSAEFQYVFKRTETLPYADDLRADTFRRMKTWLEFDCASGGVRVLERTLIGERGDTVAEGVPESLRGKSLMPGQDSREAALRNVACGGLYGGV